MLSIGDLIDQRYLITDHLGQGGMAHVYKAQDQHLERNVALKLLRPHLTDTDKERFRREIKTLASLNHPGIATIYDLGRDEHIYFTMELVEGGLFTDLGPYDSEPSSFLAFIRAAITVAEALVYVHKQGIVHRDLTPRNILLSAQGQPKVMDFGLVQLAETTRELTRTGLTLGTPQYMAPEQAKGELTGAHTDLYAFGAVLYKATTGANPFDAENDQAILYQHVYGDLIPVRDLNPLVPVALEQLIHSLLAKTPQARPSSGIQVSEQLRSILISESNQYSRQRLASPSQTGYYSSGPNAKELKVAWQETLPEGPQWPASMIAADGFLFLGLRSEEIQVRHPANGSLYTSFEADDEVNLPPLLHNKTLLFISRNGKLNSITWPEGKKLWEIKNQAISGMIPVGKDIILSSRQNKLAKINEQGQKQWLYQTESPVNTQALVHKLQAFCVTQEGWIHALDAVTGAAKYKIQVGDIAATPSAYDNLLFLPERNGSTHAFDLQTKSVLWTFDLETELWASPVAWKNQVYLIGWNGVLYCLNARTGNEIWAQQISSNITASPIIANSSIYLTTEQGELFAFDCFSGKRLFYDKLSSSAIQASPLIFNKQIVVAALDGTLKAYSSD